MDALILTGEWRHREPAGLPVSRGARGSDLTMITIEDMCSPRGRVRNPRLPTLLFRALCP